MNFIAFAALRFGLFLFYCVVTSPLFGGIFLLSHFLDSHESLHGLTWIIGFFGIAWFLGVGWMAHDTASHMLFENQSLYKSIDLSLHAARFHLSFLPLVGHWFTPAGRGKKDKDDES